MVVAARPVPPRPTQCEERGSWRNAIQRCQSVDPNQVSLREIVAHDAWPVSTGTRQAARTPLAQADAMAPATTTELERLAGVRDGEGHALELVRPKCGAKAVGVE